MKYVLILILVLNTVNVFSQNQSLPALKLYKSDKRLITIPLKEIDSLVHVSIIPVNITILDVKSITNTSALFEARILSSGEGTIDESGFCWSTTENPTISSNKIIVFTDSVYFSNGIYNLSENTKYYVRAFASNEVGISYSNQIEFSTLNKVDSLVELQSVMIGTQIWTSNNLDVSRYRNGDPIRKAITPAEWQDAASKGEGAWSYYNNDPRNGELYGKLYNWYAVNDSRGLAPKGYHIPSDSEWTILTDFLGGEGIAGLKMKSKSGWSNGGNGDNSSGFNGLPGGNCNNNGYFFDMSVDAYFWSSSEYVANNAWNRVLGYDNALVGKYSRDEKYGMSVRCLRD